MKKRGLLGLLLACMVMLGASMTVFAADKVIVCDQNKIDIYYNLIFSGGETIEIKLYPGDQRDIYVYCDDKLINADNLTEGVYILSDDTTKKYVLNAFGHGIDTNTSRYFYKLWFKEYTEEKPAEQQPSGQQPQSQPVEELGEQLGGG